MTIIKQVLKRLFVRQTPSYKYFAKHAEERMRVKEWNL